MNTFKMIAKPLMWFMAAALVALTAGCGGSDGETVAPTVTTTAPANTATGIALNANVTATFSEAMNASTITTTTFTLSQGITPVAGVVTYTGMTANFNPTGNLLASTPYTATVTTAVKDVVGNSLAASKVWSFTTGTTTDAVAPTVTSTSPADAATDVVRNVNISAVFSEVMDASTISDLSFTLAQSATPVAGVVSYLGSTATFNPTGDLAASSVYTATILGGASGVADLAGNTLAADKVWSFTTGAALAAGPAPVVLGTSVNYAILAKTLISTTATAGTAVDGDIGISPAAATYIQGFSLTLDLAGTPPGCFSTTTPGTLVTGSVYAADYNTGGCPTPANLTTAVLDMETAYTDAAGRTLPDYTELYSGDISGRTLAPGLYKWSSGVLINSDVTLNGSANDVWIFQIAGDLTMGSGASMVLTGGALPKNVFWQVGGGTGVAIGTTAHFEGVILAAKAITLNTGASGNGRLLAQTAVTLDSNAVTQPAP